MNKQFKIVKIIDEYRVVVNGGCEDFEKDEVLEVYITGKEVIDPDTKQSLGTLDFIKARLKVTTIYENMCLCMNEKNETYINPLADKLNYLTRETPKALKVNLKEISGGFDNINETINIGDLVRKAF